MRVSCVCVVRMQHSSETVTLFRLFQRTRDISSRRQAEEAPCDRCGTNPNSSIKGGGGRGGDGTGESQAHTTHCSAFFTTDCNVWSKIRLAEPFAGVRAILFALSRCCSAVAKFATHGRPVRLFIKSCSDWRFEGGVTSNVAPLLLSQAFITGR